MAIPTLLITDKDFKNPFLKKKFPFRIMGGNPPHRFKGNLELEDNRLFFLGNDVFKKVETEISIPKNDILQLYYGFDEVYNRSIGWGLGLYWKPIRLKVETIDNEPHFLYILAGFNGFTSQNTQVLEAFKEWLL